MLSFCSLWGIHCLVLTQVVHRITNPKQLRIGIFGLKLYHPIELRTFQGSHIKSQFQPQALANEWEASMYGSVILNEANTTRLWISSNPIQYLTCGSSHLLWSVAAGVGSDCTRNWCSCLYCPMSINHPPRCATLTRMCHMSVAKIDEDTH